MVLLSWGAWTCVRCTCLSVWTTYLDIYYNNILAQSTYTKHLCYNGMVLLLPIITLKICTKITSLIVTQYCISQMPQKFFWMSKHIHYHPVVENRKHECKAVSTMWVAFNDLDIEFLWNPIKIHSVGRGDQHFTGLPAEEMVAPVARNDEVPLLVFLSGSIKPTWIAQSAKWLRSVHK